VKKRILSKNQKKYFAKLDCFSDPQTSTIFSADSVLENIPLAKRK